MASPTGAEITHTHPDLPGVPLLQIPKDTVFRDRNGKVITHIALVPVPLDRSPYATPAAFSSYFMLHPGGARVQGTNPKSIRVVYPNSSGAAVGAEHDVWVYDPRGGGWTVYGTGRVSTDGTQIEPDAGVGLQEYMGFGVGFPNGPLPPGTRPTPEQPSGQDGDPVDCATGLFMHRRTDVVIVDDLPVALERSYRPGDTVVRAFGKGTNHTTGSTCAKVRCAAYQRKNLEHLCRYITRPAIANDRLNRNRAGQVVLQLKSPYQDGTTHIVMSMLEFMQRLAALVPRPRLHLIRFHGVLAVRARPRGEYPSASAAGRTRRVLLGAPRTQRQASFRDHPQRAGQRN